MGRVRPLRAAESKPLWEVLPALSHAGLPRPGLDAGAPVSNAAALGSRSGSPVALAAPASFVWDHGGNTQVLEGVPHGACRLLARLLL